MKSCIHYPAGCPYCNDRQDIMNDKRIAAVNLINDKKWELGSVEHKIVNGFLDILLVILDRLEKRK